MKIKKATLKDKKEIIKVVNDAWHHDFPGGADYIFYTDEKKDLVSAIRTRFKKYHQVYVAEENGKIIGAVFCIKSYDRYWITEMFVKRKYQGRGIGNALFKKIIGKKKQVWLTVNRKNKKALKLYRKLGFKLILEDVVMRR